MIDFVDVDRGVGKIQVRKLRRLFKTFLDPFQCIYRSLNEKQMVLHKVFSVCIHDRTTDAEGPVAVPTADDKPRVFEWNLRRYNKSLFL